MGVWKSGAGVPRSSALIITCLFKDAIWYPSFSNTPIWLCLKIWYPPNPLVSHIPYEIAWNVYPPFSLTHPMMSYQVGYLPVLSWYCCLNLYLKMSNRLTDPYGGSWNGSTPKSSFLFSDFPGNKPSSYWGTPIYGNHHIHWHITCTEKLPTSMATLVSGPRLWAATWEAFAWLLVNPLEGQEEFKEWSMGPSLSLSPKKYIYIPVYPLVN